MTRFFLTATAAAGAITLAGCSYLNTPSSAMMKQCLAVSGDGGSGNISLGDLVTWAKAQNHEFTWVHDKDATFIFRIDKSGLPGSTVGRMALEIQNSDTPSNSSGCGPGWALVTRASVNDEILTTSIGSGLARQILQSVRDHVHVQAASAETPAAAPRPIPALPVQEGNELDDEYTSESVYYEQQAEIAAKRPLSLMNRQGTRFCCWTVQRLIQRLTQGEAKARIDKTDSGSVFVSIDDPKRRWNGWATIEFELRPTPAIPEGLIITSIKADDQIVASLRDGDTTPEDVLQDILPLR
jgi:hypothetical protein